VAGQLHDFDHPERFVAGTVGEPGERIFYLQASDGAHIVSIALEKQQVAVLAERLDELLDEIRRRQGADSAIPATAPPELEDVGPLGVPIEEEFRVGALALAYEEDSGTVLIEAQSVVLDESGQPLADPEVSDSAEFTGDLLRVRLNPGPARAFAKRALRVVAAGRPPCPLCGNPLDPQGHICPRQNGHRGPH
jgi:uncharacterized repeat protein (TIGR03847 family)